MKRKNLIRFISAVFCVIALLSSAVVPALANSAQSQWEGVDQTGAIITDGDSPIIVEKELLTFDLQEFPKQHYSEIDEFLAYTGSVTAEYTFYNPSEMTVTAKLLFPFGCDAQYADFYDYEANTRLDNLDTDKYDILVNGEAANKTLRYTLSSYHDQFVLDEDLSLLHDGFVTDEFYSPELTVTKYIFKVSGVDSEKYPAADVGFDIPKGVSNYRVYYPGQNGAHRQDDGDLRIHGSVDSLAELYVFGTPFAQLPDWKLYKDGGVEDNEEISGTVSLQSSETMTFKEFALSNWSEQTGVSESDWYNATVCELNDSIKHSGDYPVVDMYAHSNAFDGSLMRWYEYEITLEAGKRITNTVTAPIYPSIDLRYDPDVFGYTYLLSPAKTWKSFGELEIVINTPYYITESNIDTFAKTENGYSLTLDGLPDSELEFVLCSEEETSRPIDNYVYPEVIYIAIALCVVLLIGGGIIAFALYRKKNRNREV